MPYKTLPPANLATSGGGEGATLAPCHSRSEGWRARTASTCSGTKSEYSTSCSSANRFVGVVPRVPSVLRFAKWSSSATASPGGVPTPPAAASLPFAPRAPPTFSNSAGPSLRRHPFEARKHRRRQPGAVPQSCEPLGLSPMVPPLRQPAPLPGPTLETPSQLLRALWRREIGHTELLSVSCLLAVTRSVAQDFGLGKVTRATQSAFIHTDTCS